MRVVGGAPELGEWDLDRGLHLERGKLRLSSGPVDLEATTAVEYQYVRMRPGEKPLWEVGEDRVWDTTSTGELARQAIIKDT